MVFDLGASSMTSDLMDFGVKSRLTILFLCGQLFVIVSFCGAPETHFSETQPIGPRADARVTKKKTCSSLDCLPSGSKSSNINRVPFFSLQHFPAAFVVKSSFSKIPALF